MKSQIEYLCKIMDNLSIDYFSDLNFISFGRVKKSQEIIFREDFTYWGLQFCRRGKFYLKIGNSKPEIAEDGCVFVTFPGEKFRYGAASPGEGIENKMFLCFSGERVKRYLAGNMLVERKKNALLPLADPDHFMQKMWSIITLLQLPKSEMNHAKAVLQLEELLLEMQKPAVSVNHHENIHLQAFSTLVEKIVSTPEYAWDFEKEARKISISYAHFRRLFVKIYKVPPWTFVTSARLEKAASLLSATDLQINEIANECGFEDEFYFSRLFKKNYQLSPKAHRERFK